MKEAMLWSKENGNIRCNLCARRCLIQDGKTGFCLVRKNIKGKLYSLNYGKLISVSVDPIEKKPLFHFLPGSMALSIAAAGCNFACKFCQNWEISQVYREGTQEVVGEEYTPEEIVSLAVERECKTISYTYTEPTIFFEFAYDTSRLAKKKGLKNMFVTNGYMTPEAVEEISKYLDAATVDFKGSANSKFYLEFSSVPKVEPIFECLLEMKKRKIFIEITDLIIPRIGDKEEDFVKLVKWIHENLGSEIPFHILRFFPHYKLTGIPPTPISLMEKFAEKAKEIGMKYVYLGNIPGHELEHTYCPNCGEKLIERVGFFVRSKLKVNKCPKCGTKINVILE